jgi:thiamine biosynthesis lipoprotein
VWLVALVLALSACGEQRGEAVQLAGATMGTRYHITWLEAPGQPTAEEVHLGVEALLEAVNASMSTYREDSEISRFNRADPDAWFPVSADFAAVFAMARAVSQASGGAYDVTVAPLVDLWGFGPDMGSEIPPPDTVAAAMAMVGESRLEFDGQRRALRKPANMGLDFSSIAKGYCVDKLADWLQAQGMRDYLVEIGGEIRVAGLNPHGRQWRVAVEKPEPMQREVMSAVTLTDAAIATSGDYRNFFEVEGVRYSHTIDPRTGAPVQHELVSVTVVHPSAALADAWATALTVLGPEQAKAVALREDLAVYMIQRDGGDFSATHTPAMEPLLGME